MSGIKELKEMVLFICKLGEGAVKAFADGAQITDVVDFAPAAKAALPAFSGLKEIGSEIADLDENEKQELFQYVQDEFDIPDDKIEAFIEKSFRVVVHLVDFVQDCVDLFGNTGTDPAE